MSNTSSLFDPAAYLLAFHGREELLDHYLDSIPRADLTIQRPVRSVADFVTHLSQCDPPERHILTLGLREADGLVSNNGHERMLSVLRVANKCAQTLLEMPAECLALWILINARELFDSALSAGELGKCETMYMFQPNTPVSLVPDNNLSSNRFQVEMAASCGERFGTSRILLGGFDDSDSVIIGFYFEKFPKIRRSLDGSVTNPTLVADEKRVIQLNAVGFERSTGVLSVCSPYGTLTEQSRKGFAGAYLNAPDAYEWAGASRILQLSNLIEGDRPPRDTSGREVLITGIDYTWDDGDRDCLSGRDLLESCKRKGIIQMIRQSVIHSLVIKMPLKTSNGYLNVKLTAPNKVSFRRGPDAPYILSQLRTLDVLQIQETARTAA